MAKDLKALIRLQKWHVDERRKLLGQLLKNEAEAVQAIKMMEMQHEREKEIAARITSYNVCYTKLLRCNAR